MMPKTMPNWVWQKVKPEWRVIEGYKCGQCGGPARAHPKTNRIWGCLGCDMSTFSVAFYFVEDKNDSDR